METINVDAQRAMGLTAYDAARKGMKETERQTLHHANSILGFS